MTIERKLTQDIKIIKYYFICFLDVCKKLEIKRQNLYNINKIDFRIKCDKAYIVIILKISKRFVLTNVDNRNYIILIECVNASNNNYVLLLFLIVISK